MAENTQKALVYTAPGEYGLYDVPVPTIIKPTDAIVRVTLSTICGSDVHIVAGHAPIMPPRRLGHEFCGEVVELGSAVKGFEIGDRVALSCLSYCGECYYCRKGVHIHCPDPDSDVFGALGILDGCQTEFVRIPYAANTMYKIPAGLTEEDVLLVGDILSTGYFGAEQAEIEPGDTVAVIGSGPVGMCAMMAAKLWGPAKIIAVDIEQYRLDACLKQGIADVALNPNDVNVVEKIRELTEGRGADKVIEANGAEATMLMAMDAVRTAGHICTVGVFIKPMEFPMQYLWFKNLKISMGHVPCNRVPELIKLIEAGKIDTKFMYTHKAPLNDIVKGYDIFGNKKEECIKWLVTPYEK